MARKRPRVNLDPDQGKANLMNGDLNRQLQHAFTEYEGVRSRRAVASAQQAERRKFPFGLVALVAMFCVCFAFMLKASTVSNEPEADAAEVSGVQVMENGRFRIEIPGERRAINIALEGGDGAGHRIDLREHDPASRRRARIKNDLNSSTGATAF